jgi:hypothetical protein
MTDRYHHKNKTIHCPFLINLKQLTPEDKEIFKQAQTNQTYQYIPNKHQFITNTNGIQRKWNSTLSSIPTCVDLQEFNSEYLLFNKRYDVKHRLMVHAPVIIDNNTEEEEEEEEEKKEGLPLTQDCQLSPFGLVEKVSDGINKFRDRLHAKYETKDISLQDLGETADKLRRLKERDLYKNTFEILDHRNNFIFWVQHYLNDQGDWVEKNTVVIDLTTTKTDCDLEKLYLDTCKSQAGKELFISELKDYKTQNIEEEEEE